MKKLLLLIPVLAIVACDQPAQRTDAELNEAFKNFLMDNPEVIMESVENFQKEQMQKAEQEASQKLSALLPDILSSGPYVGNADAKNVIVEYFDYNCGYCKRAAANVDKILAEQEDVKIIFKELPILSPASEMLSRAALAVHEKQPEKYYEFHKALMKNRAKPDQALIEKIAKDVGITKVNFENDMKLPAVTAEISGNLKISSQIGVRGTPAFIINGELVRGAVPYSELVKYLK